MTDLDFETSWAKLGRIHDLILGSDDAADMQFTFREPAHWPHWYLELLSQVHVLVRDDAIVHLSSSVCSGDAPDGQVSIFTDTLVVVASVTSDPATSTWPRVTAVAWRRSDLVDVSVRQLDPFPTRQHRLPRQWPVRTEITLTYPNRTAMTLPLGQRPSQEAFRSLFELLESVVQNLSDGRDATR